MILDVLDIFDELSNRFINHIGDVLLTLTTLKV